MALLNPCGPSFSRWSDNFGPLSTDGTTGFGTAVSVPASNTDSADTSVLSALSHDCEYLWLGITGLGVSTQVSCALMDLLVDPAGGTSWSTLITDLLVGYSNTVNFTATSSSMPLEYHLPLWLPAGASLGARIRRQDDNTATGRIMAVAAGGNRNPASWWCGQKVETVGTLDAANSSGQALTPGSAIAVSGAANNGSGLIRLTVSSTTGWSTGDVKGVAGVTGTTEANGVWTITVVSGTTIDLQGSTFTNAYVSGGLVSRNFSSWADLGSATGARAGALQYAVGGVVADNSGSPAGGTSNMISQALEVQFGAGGSLIGPRVYRGNSSSETGANLFRGPIFCDIPAGTQMQVRAASSAASITAPSGVIDVAAYLVQ